MENNRGGEVGRRRAPLARVVGEEQSEADDSRAKNLWIKRGELRWGRRESGEGAIREKEESKSPGVRKSVVYVLKEWKTDRQWGFAERQSQFV